MITLVLTVCTVVAPAMSSDDPAPPEPTCREVAVALDAETPMACFAGAPMVVAQWIETHPKSRIAGWRCETAGPSWRI